MNQVMRYDHADEYLNPDIQGKPVSAKFKTWEEAEKVRNLLREGEPRYYYNIVCCTGVAVIDRETDNGRCPVKGPWARPMTRVQWQD